jgi:hypothetical protein
VARRFHLLTDEHFPTSLLDVLRKDGWEVQRIVDVLTQGTPDEEAFAYAAENRLVWVSSDERAQKWPRLYLEQKLPFVGMLVRTQESRYRMRPGEFVRQLAAIEGEDDPFAWGIRHIKPE